MMVSVIDHTRTTRFTPAKPFDAQSDLFATLDSLLAGHTTHSGQIRLECDKEFLSALENQAKNRKSELLPRTPASWPEGYSGEYKGFPIFVGGA